MSEKNEKETSRVEAFSDGVFAIAMTLLIIELGDKGYGQESIRSI